MTMRALLFTSLVALTGCTVIVDANSYHSRRDAEVDPADASVDARRPDGGDASVEQGECTPECGEGAACCDGACRPLGTLSDCASCDDSCGTPAHASSLCVPGTGCQFRCDDGFADCNGEPADGCEQSLVDSQHCGACNMACDATAFCATTAAGATCVSTCATGQMPCNGACVDTRTSTQHCGGCGNVCPEPANTSAMCASSSCRADCDSGYDDCNHDTSDGCEAALVTFYGDADGDGWGNASGATMQGCPGGAIGGYAQRSGDCNDGSRDVAPGATELCNAVDDDCDGTPDDVFECVRGETRACTVTVGSCSVPGRQTCGATCGWGACVAPEMCNRMDDNCDGFADDGALATGNPQPIFAIGQYRFDEVRADFSGPRGEVGVAFGALTQTNGMSTWPVYFARVDAATGRVLGNPILVATTPGGQWDIAWDGTHWTVIAGETINNVSNVYTYRVEATGARVVRGVNLGVYGSDVTIERIGATSELLAAVGSHDRGLVARVTAPATFETPAALIGTSRAITTATGERVRGVAATSSATAAYLFVGISTNSSGTTFDTRWLTIAPSAGSLPDFVSLGMTDASVRVSHDAQSGLVGILASRYNQSTMTESAAFRTLNVQSRQLSPELALSGGSGGGIASAADGTFGVFVGRYWPASGTLSRIRATDRAVAPNPFSIGTFQGLVGVRQGNGRYLHFGDDSALRATPIACN